MLNSHCWGDATSAKYPEASLLYQAGDYTKAAELLLEKLALEPDKRGLYALGCVYGAAGDPLNAAKALLGAVRGDQFYHEAWHLLGEAYIACGQGMSAVEAYGQAVAIDPSNEQYKQKMINVVSTMTFRKSNPNLKGVLIECLESNEAEMIYMGQAWLSMVQRDVSVGPYYKLSKHKSYSAFKKDMARFGNCDGLIDPFFLTGLGKFIVSNRGFENWAKHLRRYMLESVVEGRGLFSDESDIELMLGALSRYCFLTDYIMSDCEEEQALLEALEQRINKDAPNVALAALACYGCYKPLYNLPAAEAIASGLKGGNHVSQIFKSQIEDHIAQQEISEQIETLGQIEGDISKAVQAQYEDFPYPRWDAVARDLFDPQMEGHLKDKKVEILVAGCGTGKEAVQMAYVFPDAQITAVDLSKTSLAYAIFKTRQLGIKNIRFYQADIMALADVTDWAGRFDYIASAGVLHHMKDPKAGWNVLSGLLKDDGLMRIGLYSRHVRWAINEARAVIKDKEMGSDAESIKAFRDDASGHLKYKTAQNIEKIFDYYNLSECRDLLFHTHEHQFDLLQLKEHLDALGLAFLQFYIGPKTLAKYEKQNAKTGADVRDLECWARWEEKNPEAFVSMYRFWCEKI